MLLKSLKLKDFRQFKGEQTIVFADDQTRNVTIIMGDNGTGKTTLAQAFTWCLYGETTFKDKILLCKAKSSEMIPGQKTNVRAELILIHKDIEYIITSEQEYRKTDKSDKPIDTVGQRLFKIMYKQSGQMEPVGQSKLDGRMREILPQELARYFFFDGENIKIMGDELSQGKGNEFARAVKSLLGLDGFTAAIGHLKKTIREYDKKYDTHSDNQITVFNNQIADLEIQIEKIDERISEIDDDEAPTHEKIDELTEQLEKTKKSEELAKKKKKLDEQLAFLEKQKSRNISELVLIFKQAPLYFSKKMMYDSLQLLESTGKTKMNVPFVNADTLKCLLERKRCICGTELNPGSDPYMELSDLFNYVPPKSIRDSIADFRQKCIEHIRNCETMFTKFKEKYDDVCSFDGKYNDTQDDISDIESQLLGIDEEGIGKMQADLMRFKTHLRNLNNEKLEKTSERGGKTTDLKRIENERDKLVLMDENNRSVIRYKAYAQYMYDKIKNDYAQEEQKIRHELEKVVNDIFHNILDEGFTLKLTEKYDVEVSLSKHSGSSETSTAQNISIIFAFIAGVIQMARNSQKDENSLLVSEPYPLVMDAPLSSFDKTRIQNVCDILPKIAQQIIIFIKDTDGNIAEEHLGSRIGKRLVFNATSKIETYIQ
jgi:DNA sulfur modification protein DndD